jgi:UDP-N-acetylmuramoyl-tripeptide--D-alanyl-D-alanine ligase
MTDLTTTGWIALALCWIGLLPASARWLRVAQREHYLAGSVTRFALRWWFGVRMNAPLLLLALLATGLSWRWPVAAVGTAAVAVVAPIGLSVRGRTSPLGLTRRLVTLAAIWWVLEACLVGVGFVIHRPLVVAITGSFGKTSTKQHVAHLLAGSRTVVASPASFNNRAGLARAINEHLLPTGPRSSWPRWAPTGRARSPSSAAGARPPLP